MVNIENLKGNHRKVYDALISVHTIKQYPSALWVLITVKKGSNLATFYDLLDVQRKITVDWITHHCVPLHQYKVFTDYPINQEEIDAATDAGREAPPADKEYRLIIQILEMILRADEVSKYVDPEAIAGKEKINPVQLETLMKVAFKDYDAEVFKSYHMEKVWKWFLIIKKYYENLPPYVEPTPAVEPAAAANIPVE